MITAVGLPVLNIDRGQRSEGSGHFETDHNSLKCNLGQDYIHDST